MKKKPLPLFMMILYHQHDASMIYPFYAVDDDDWVRWIDSDGSTEVTDFNIYLSPIHCGQASLAVRLNPVSSPPCPLLRTLALHVRAF